MSKHIAVHVTDMVEKLTWPAYKEAEYMVDIISDEANKTITGKMAMRYKPIKELTTLM